MPPSFLSLPPLPGSPEAAAGPAGVEPRGPGSYGPESWGGECRGFAACAVAGAQDGQLPQNTTSASSTAKPLSADGVRQGAAPTAQSTSSVRPQWRHTRWWWLSPVRRSKRAAWPAGWITRTSPDSAKDHSTL